MKNLIGMLIITSFLFSCKKEKTGNPEVIQGPAGANGTVPPGTISGKITQTDQFSHTYTSGLNSTTLSIDGTTLTTVTNSTGNYTLSNVPPGIYDISLIKNGTGLSKIQQINFPGNGTMYLNGTIADKATYQFTGGYVKDSLQQIKLVVSYLSTNFTKQSLVIFGKTPAVNINVPSSYDAVQAFYIFPNSTTFSYTQSYNILDSTVYTSGTTIYAKVYPDNNLNSGYNDYANGTFIYTGCGTPLPTTFTLTRP